MQPTEVDAMVPDYERECSVCDQSPCVTAIKNGKIIHEFDLCGPCCFGTAEALDPTTWN